MFDYKEYWNKRYQNGGTSGIGSYDKYAILKGNYINNLISTYNIKLINDYGHGDCNQLKYITGFKSYTGYDVSSHVRKMCKSKFDNTVYNFIDDVNKFKYADLSMSLDVLYHIINDNDYIEYLNSLFKKTKYTLIYAKDMEQPANSTQHIVHRNFTKYIDTNFESFELIDITEGIQPMVNFYLYKKNT